MPYSVSAKNDMLNALGIVITHAALFNGDPSGAGVEISGGAPAYARQPISWDPAAGGIIENSGVATFDVPACTVNYVAFYDALVAGNLKAYGTVTAEVFGSQGTYTLSQALLDLNLVCP
jgi:hypothetical protein